MEYASSRTRFGVLLLAILMVVTVLVVVAPTPADATVTVSCGSLEHGGVTSSDYAWAYWNYVNDPDCRIRAAAKCGDTPSDPSAVWYWGSYKYLGATSFRYCPLSNPELNTWGFGWTY